MEATPTGRARVAWRASAARTPAARRRSIPELPPTTWCCRRFAVPVEVAARYGAAADHWARSAAAVRRWSPTWVETGRIYETGRRSNWHRNDATEQESESRAHCWRRRPPEPLRRDATRMAVRKELLERPRLEDAYQSRGRCVRRPQSSAARNRRTYRAPGIHRPPG